jgi:type I restriction enzyme S subunit
VMVRGDHPQLLLSDKLLKLIPNEMVVDRRYLVRALRSPAVVAHFARRAGGSSGSMTNITQSDIREAAIPLPRLAEQRRIATILDQADDLRAKRRDALAQLDSLTQAIFVEMFGGTKQSPVEIGAGLHRHPKGWKWELLTDVARLATGHTPDRKRADYWNGSIPWITLTEIRRLDGRTAYETEQAITPAGIENSSAVVLPVGTVCLSRTASVGFVTTMGREMSTSQDFVNWVCGPRVLPEYLMQALIASRTRLKSLSTGSTHKTIYFPAVEQFRLLVPPYQLQEIFAQRSQMVRQLATKAGTALLETTALFRSLQYRAFHGEL